jgi:F0F1-type ATP synthase membrane subunit c/vacuolar-type H+-ATPase subunit K
VEKATKLIAAAAALAVALGGLAAAFGFGGEPAPTGTLIILDSPDAYRAFLESHPG